MRTALLSITLLLVFLALGCGTAQNPINVPSDMQDSDPILSIREVQNTSIPTFIFKHDRQVIVFDLLPPDRVAQADGDPGTNMTHAELCVYFAAHCAQDIAGGMPWECWFYEWFYSFHLGQGEMWTALLVWIFETNGYDIPDELDIEPPC